MVERTLSSEDVKRVRAFLKAFNRATQGSGKRPVFHDHLVEGQVGFFTNPCADAVTEKRLRVQKLQKKLKDLRWRVDQLVGEVKRAEAEAEQADVDYERFLNTGEIPDSLLPEYNYVVEPRARKELRTAKKSVVEELAADKRQIEGLLNGTDWCIDGAHADGAYAYITLCRRLPERLPSLETVRDRWCRRRDEMIHHLFEVHWGGKSPQIVPDYIDSLSPGGDKPRATFTPKFERVTYVGTRLNRGLAAEVSVHEATPT